LALALSLHEGLRRLVSLIQSALAGVYTVGTISTSSGPSLQIIGCGYEGVDERGPMLALLRLLLRIPTGWRGWRGR
jgi:hypothetical protein